MRIELPPGMPTWTVAAVLLVVALPTLALLTVRVVNRVFPSTTEDRLAWWKAFWKQRAEAKAARRQWLAQVRCERRARRVTTKKWPLGVFPDRQNDQR
ncbi:hypothetical protein [Amycolatopsis pretoriensis]|uniref:hypothetical protein n=1 Tax=Amycolatopsis pretoriensis TaxID=218821 RepID=UPI00115F7B02|nr:hypothetical protein [Amycolatopsis pretoriensis]